MIHVSYVDRHFQTIEIDFSTNIELIDWLRYKHSHFSPLKAIYIRFKDGHNIEFVHAQVGPFMPTYAA